MNVNTVKAKIKAKYQVKLERNLGKYNIKYRFSKAKATIPNNNKTLK